MHSVVEREVPRYARNDSLGLSFVMFLSMILMIL